MTTTTWAKSVIKEEEVSRYLRDDGSDFVDDAAIERQLAEAGNPEPARIRDILAKSGAIQTLTPEETAMLLNVEDEDLLAEMRETALRNKLKVYDNRIVTFAPLYCSSFCVNDCLYCGFRAGNGEMTRRRLTIPEVEAETRALAGTFGHKRLVVVYGEHPSSDADYIAETIDAIYNVQVPTRKGAATIRRVNVNAAPMSIADLKRLGHVGLGTFQVFQETYHHETYRKLHGTRGPKGNYRWRLYSMHRAQEAGVSDVGLGALFGLYDWKFEVMGLLCHTRELEARFGGVGAHTISFPRLEPASNAPFLSQSRYQVSDRDFLKIITVLRLAVPYTGLICTAREPAPIRDEAVRLGITQMDASTRIGIGAYSERWDEQERERQQFMLGDSRSLEELVGDLAHMGTITSFCTAGYRIGRTGERIMRLLRSCEEGKFCKLNAVITFREWLDDFASDVTRAFGEELIRKELAESMKAAPAMAGKLTEYYERTAAGERDLYL